MADDAVVQSWPHLAALVDLLDALDGRTVTVGVRGGVHGASVDIDRIHEGLLRKQRATGSLGLNE